MKPEEWEYKCVHVHVIAHDRTTPFDSKKITGGLTLEGRQGWELVQVIKDDTLFLFKRRKATAMAEAA